MIRMRWSIGHHRACCSLTAWRCASRAALPQKLDQCLDFIGVQMIPIERDQIGKT
jgi:hypothetical protein